MHRLALVLIRTLVLIPFGILCSDALAQWVTKPIVGEDRYAGQLTPDGEIEERVPIEGVIASIPEEVQTAAFRLTGVSGKSSSLEFSCIVYSPGSVLFLFDSIGMTRSVGEIDGKRNHSLVAFYPLIYASDHYSAYAHGFFIFADLISSRRALVRVELDMDLTLDAQASLTRITGDARWREPCSIGWSQVKIGLGDLDPQDDLTPLTDPKAVMINSKDPKLAHGDPPTRGILASCETSAFRAGSGFFLAPFPVSILQKLEQAFETPISSPGIIYNPKARLSGESIQWPFATNGSGFHLRSDDQVPLESTFRVLMLGADDKEVYAVTTFFITRPGSGLAAIVSAELNIHLDGNDGPGEVHWAGPFLGDWQQIRGFNHKPITDLIRP